MKRLIPILILLLFLSTIYLIMGKNSDSDENVQICFSNKKCIYTEIARTPEERSRGLMYRESLDEDRGMLFIFSDEDYYAFWMKNMNFPIDMIWVNKDYRIVHVESNVLPCTMDFCPSYKPPEKALYVIETQANFTRKYDIQINSTVIGI